MKKFISGLIVGLMLSSTVAFASSQDISAVLTSFNFVVNGQVKTVSTQPIVYNGTSYLPVRDLSNMLGYSVAYDDASRTIDLSNQTQSAADPDQTSSDPSNEFVSPKELLNLSGIGSTWSGDSASFYIGSDDIENRLSFKIPSLDDGVYLINTNYGSFHLKVDKTWAYVKPDEIKDVLNKFYQ